MPQAHPSADRILSLSDDDKVQTFISDLLRQRELSNLIKSLNSAALSGAEHEKRNAIAALRRIGFWAGA
jgi:uncharacterized protein YerC